MRYFLTILDTKNTREDKHMNSKWWSYIHLVIFVLSGTGLSAQTDWPLQHVDKRSGLSNSAINSIYMDHKDYVWFGTWDGLNRYDGDEVISYKPIAEDTLSVSNNIVRQVLEDKHQNLWIITHNGINRYDRKLNQFQRYFHNLKGIPFLENSLKASLSEDSTLYISLVGWGVGKFEDNRFIRVNLPHGSGKNIHNIGIQNNVVYAVDDKGNLFTTEGSKKPSKLNWSPNIYFQRFVTINDRLYYIYQYKQAQLEMKELKNGSIIGSYTLDLDQSLVTGLGLARDNQSLYLGTNDGQLIQLSIDHREMIVKNLNVSISAISDRKLKIFSIYESAQGILWIGTDGDGVYKYLTKDRAFTPIPEGASGGKLSHSIVRSIYLDKTKVYAGTRSGGLNIVGSATTSLLNKTNGLSDNTVLSIARDQSGNMWLGVDNEGVDMIEAETGDVLHFPADFINAPEELYFGSVYKIFLDAYGHLWLGTSGYGVVYLDVAKKAKGQYELRSHYTITPNEEFGSHSLKSNIVYAITSEEPNILWFGTRNGGLYRYNSLTRKFTHSLGEGENKRYALSNNDILSLYLDDRNKLWVGTSGGLNKINLNDYTVQQYSQSEGLANNTIHGILEDHMNRLWLSSNNGLFAFTPTTNTFKNFNWTDGLLNYEYTDGAYFQDQENNLLYFGGTKGIDIVDPTKIDTSSTFPRLAMTDFYINNVPVAPGDSSSILQTHIDFQQSITLNYDQNFLTFRFTTLDYWHKQRCTYRYQLSGFDAQWIAIGRQSNINLTNIPPGRYTLLLNNSNENGDWNPQVRQLSIIINPPFWATNTAYVMYALLAIAMQIGLIQVSRNRAKKKKAREIEKLKKEQADTIQKYKLEFFTDIAHEFRTPLTLILGPVVKLLEKTKNNAELNNAAQSIYKNSLRLQKLIQELIQFRKVEMGKEQLRIRPINAIAFTEELLHSFKQYAIEKEIALTYEAPEVLHAQLDSDILEKILINLVSNALKYTEDGGKVAVKIWSEGVNIHFMVRDNGPGIPENEVNRIFERFSSIHHEKEDSVTNSAGIGLSLTKKLIDLHHGEIKVSSTPAEGTSFTFWLPGNLPTQEQQHQDTIDSAVLTKLKDHVQAEFYHTDRLDTELINISLERFEHNLLIIDDNLQILNLLKDMLSPKYNVTTCTRAHEALSILKSRKIDLVISDVIMPEMSGYELCDAVKTKIETSHIPVILLTAKGELEERIEGLRSGADAYIPKPFHPDHLKVRIEKLIGTRELLKRKFEAFNADHEEFSSFGIGEKDDEFFRAIDQFIKDEMGNQQLDAQHLANHLGMSKTSLYKKVRALTGLTPHSLFNQYRLKRAAYLLTNTDLNVSEIIYMTGFNSRSYFYKSFQEMFHCSPSGYSAGKN